MRFRALPSALFAVLLLLALPAVAAADPKPILKPEDKPVQPAPSPPPAPPTTPSVQINTTPAAVEPKKTVTPVVTKPAVTKPPPVLPSQGGRDQSGVVVATVPPPPEPVVQETPVTAPVTAASAPDPTPLALVRASERESEPSTATPPWKLALLALLAAAEAFLLVRLVRNRPTALSPIQ